MKHRLYIVEGLPCSGKSTISAYIAEALGQSQKVCFVDEGTGAHPADYEYHALAPAGFLGDESCIVPLSRFSGEALEALLPYKIYDGLPWEIEKPLMLEKWQQFVKGAQMDMTYVFNCVFLQNPMCETMMRFGYTQEISFEYIKKIADIIDPLNPVVIYLKNDDIANSIMRASSERPGWLNAVIDYHVHGAYGTSIGALGFDGYIRCLHERQQRELSILSRLSMKYVITDNPQRDWYAALENLRTCLADI